MIKPIPTAKFKKPSGGLASQTPIQILKFERADWTSFRTVEGLQQKAGVSADKLRRLVLKELTDNGLDTGASVNVGHLPDGGYFIEDDGGGIDGTPEDIARLFSIARPMVSTKLLRLPTRGALGNGLRVVAGAVLASDGSLVVTTRNKRIELRPERDGSTTVVSVKPVNFPVGTRIEIGFGPAIPEDANALRWAVIATEMAQGHVLHRQVVAVVVRRRAISRTAVSERQRAGARTGREPRWLYWRARWRDRCRSRTEPHDLRRHQPQAGRHAVEGRAGACASGQRRSGLVLSVPIYSPTGPTPRRAEKCRSALDHCRAAIPFVVEAWARERADMAITVCVNRTPVTGDIYAARDKRDIDLFGCGLATPSPKRRRTANFDIRLNITKARPHRGGRARSDRGDGRPLEDGEGPVVQPTLREP